MGVPDLAAITPRGDMVTGTPYMASKSSSTMTRPNHDSPSAIVKHLGTINLSVST